MSDFSSLPLDAALRPGLDALGYTSMTPVQADALPVIPALKITDRGMFDVDRFELIEE